MPRRRAKMNSRSIRHAPSLTATPHEWKPRRGISVHMVLNSKALTLGLAPRTTARCHAAQTEGAPLRTHVQGVLDSGW
eukprot:4792527-Pyramimonas_sp.AAC.1